MKKIMLKPDISGDLSPRNSPKNSGDARLNLTNKLFVAPSEKSKDPLIIIEKIHKHLRPQDWRNIPPSLTHGLKEVINAMRDMKLFVCKTDQTQKNQTMMYSQRFVDMNRLVSDTKIELRDSNAHSQI
jgi:hypothetical protein